MTMEQSLGEILILEDEHESEQNPMGLHFLTAKNPSTNDPSYVISHTMLKCIKTILPVHVFVVHSNFSTICKNLYNLNNQSKNAYPNALTI
jgi:hypothetical protein